MCIRDSVERADIGMLERGNGFGFALHALFQFRVVGKMGGQYLDSDGPVEPGVLGEIDFSQLLPYRPHRAAIESRKGLVLRQR